MELEDGDFLDLNWIATGKNKLAILCHGLEGSARSRYMRGMAIERLWRDARVLAIGGGATEVMLDEAAKHY